MIGEPSCSGERRWAKMAMYEGVEKVIDFRTGEIVSEVGFSTAYRKTDDLYYTYRFYCEDGALFTKDLPRVCDYIINNLVKEVRPYSKKDPCSLTIKIGKDDFKRWADDTGGAVSAKTFKNRLVDVVKADILRRVSRGTYMLNPYFMYKGNPADIKKARSRWDELAKAGQGGLGTGCQSEGIIPC